MVWEHVTRTNLLLQVFTFQKVREGQLCGNVESGEFLWEVGVSLSLNLSHKMVTV